MDESTSATPTTEANSARDLTNRPVAESVDDGEAPLFSASSSCHAEDESGNSTEAAGKENILRPAAATPSRISCSSQVGVKAYLTAYNTTGRTRHIHHSFQQRLCARDARVQRFLARCCELVFLG